jgi:pimeloyl-ACP methyl ester carboxylesterase
MNLVRVGKENGADIELYYEDHGSGKPVVLIHGYPLSGASWEKQVSALLNAGYRVITYDRRGFGRSSQPTDGYNYDTFAEDLQKLGKRVSEEVVRASWNIAAGASATASLACVSTWIEDFRQDVARIDVPTLIIHGDEDRIVPFAASGQRTAKLIKGARLLVIKGGPHCVTWTHAGAVNAALLDFMQD